MSRGILATVSAPALDGVTAEDVRAAYVKAYADEPFIHVLPEGQWPDQGRDPRRQHRCTSRRRSTRGPARLIAIGAMDNLAKGTAGGAIQSMNIALGLPETTGLTTIGVAP